MKKITALMLSSAMMLSLAACGGSASTETVSSEAASSEAASSEAVSTEEAASADAAAVTTVNAGKLTMSTNAAFPPYEMTTDAGDFEGIDIEVAGAIAEKLGLELQVDDMDFDAALLAAQNGKSDIVMAGVTVTDERQKVMDFSDTYAEGIQSIIVPEDSDIASADDLTGKAIGTQRGTTGYIYCTDDFGEDNVIAYDDGLTAVQALNNGQVDAVAVSYTHLSPSARRRKNCTFCATRLPISWRRPSSASTRRRTLPSALPPRTASTMTSTSATPS